MILVTDGEETCGGNPARAIQKLVKSGINVRINIVGFAVEDAKLAAIFQLWSDTGGGKYYDARDAKGLSDAFSLAVRPAFEVVDAQGSIVESALVGGEPVRHWGVVEKRGFGAKGDAIRFHRSCLIK